MAVISSQKGTVTQRMTGQIERCVGATAGERAERGRAPTRQLPAAPVAALTAISSWDAHSWNSELNSWLHFRMSGGRDAGQIRLPGIPAPANLLQEDCRRRGAHVLTTLNGCDRRTFGCNEPHESSGRGTSSAECETNRYRVRISCKPRLIHAARAAPAGASVKRPDGPPPPRAPGALHDVSPARSR